MTITLVIPVISQSDNLNKCLNSIFKATPAGDLFIKLLFDDPFTMEKYRPWVRGLPNVTIDNLGWYKEPAFFNRQLQSCLTDVLVYLHDTVEISPDLFVNLAASFAERFPDYDGVVGFTSDSNEKAFGAIGMKYAERFPGRAVWNTKYNMFGADKELQDVAEQQGCFYQCPDTTVKYDFDINQFTCAKPIKIQEWLTVDMDTYNANKTV